MNPNLGQLEPYPFQKLAALTKAIQPPAKPLVNMAIGEPRDHPPEVVTASICKGLAALATYPSTRGERPVRQAITDWLARRYRLAPQLLDPDRHVLPVSGSREALFSVVQTQIDARGGRPLVLMPNPFYQIYEGAARLAGAEPYYVNTDAANDYRMDFAAIPASVWARTQLVFICSPSNPTGQVMREQDYALILERSREYGFLIAADECYAELYDDETAPPVGLLQAAANLGVRDFARCIVFHSLSKRSSVPGLRGGFVAGDADFLQNYFTLRTYYGSAPSMLAQNALIAALADEEHVRASRARYRRKFDDALAILGARARRPAGGFYLWLATQGDDERFAAGLYAAEHVLTLPGRYLSRPTPGGDPGAGYVRIALVGSEAECHEGVLRLRAYMDSLATR